MQHITPMGKKTGHALTQDRWIIAFLNTAYDHIEEKRGAFEDELLDFLETDPLLLWDDHFSKLFHKQSILFQPLIDAFNIAFGTALTPSKKLGAAKLLEDDTEKVRGFLKALPLLPFSALYFMAEALSSVLLAMLLSAQKITIDGAIAAAFLEEHMQQEKWGQMDEHTAKEKKVREELKMLHDFTK